jgi:hypothetical protein
MSLLKILEVSNVNSEELYFIVNLLKSKKQRIEELQKNVNKGNVLAEMTIELCSNMPEEELNKLQGLQKEANTLLENELKELPIINSLLEKLDL